MIGITTVEHGVATVFHEIAIGAKAVGKVIAKAEVVVQADAPTVEALTALVDPRAAVVERIGAALLGELEPQVAKVAGDVAANAATPTVTLSAELWNELKSLYSSASSEIVAAKASLAAS